MNIIQYKSQVNEEDLALLQFPDEYDSKDVDRIIGNAENQIARRHFRNELEDDNPLDAILYILKEYGVKRLYVSDTNYSSIL
jgi:hypothetical protein